MLLNTGSLLIIFSPMLTKNFPKKLAVKKPIIIKESIATTKPVPGILKGK